MIGDAVDLPYLLRCGGAHLQRLTLSDSIVSLYRNFDAGLPLKVLKASVDAARELLAAEQ